MAPRGAVDKTVLNPSAYSEFSQTRLANRESGARKDSEPPR